MYVQFPLLPLPKTQTRIDLIYTRYQEAPVTEYSITEEILGTFAAEQSRIVGLASIKCEFKFMLRVPEGQHPVAQHEVLG